tara:strand:+ start:555 stop:1841 length:1287 start_codon:yes stop_codon:yes gene_type:complete
MNVYKSSYLIIGKGVTFNHCSRFFEDNNISYDSITSNDILDIKDNLIICKDRTINLKKIDFSIISPGIPPSAPIIKKLSKQRCKFITDIELIQKLSKSKFICVTGTNGKTSTVNLLSNILNDNNIKAIACGNNGVSVFDSLKSEYDYVIIELSSYQLEHINILNSHIAIILNLSSDHLDRHGSLYEYMETKLKIFKNTDHSLISKDLNVANKYDTFYLEGTDFFVFDNKIEELSLKNNKEIVYLSNIYKISGRHEALNLCACIAILNVIGIPLGDVINSFSKRKHLEHRVEEFCVVNGVRFINDSKSTNANSTHNALESNDRNIILIMGGDKKNLSYKILNKPINKKVKILILIGENKDHLDEELKVEVKKAYFKSLDEAINYIFSQMIAGDTVLMSPGTSSYYNYSNFEQRGNHFKELVSKYACQQN